MSRENCRLEILLVGVLLLLGILVPNRAVAQINPPAVEWERTFGGEGNDRARSVQETTDGGYIVAGGTRSFGFGGETSDAYLFKTDRVGNLLWQNTFGGRESEYVSSVQETTDGGYIVAGRTLSFGAGSSYDVYLVKTDSEGDGVWEKTFGGEAHDWANSVQETTEGGYIVAGLTASFDAGGGGRLPPQDRQSGQQSLAENFRPARVRRGLVRPGDH